MGTPPQINTPVNSATPGAACACASRAIRLSTEQASVLQCPGSGEGMRPSLLGRIEEELRGRVDLGRVR